MISKDIVIQAVTDYLQDTDYFLIDINVSPGNQILVEIDSCTGVSLDFCVLLNRHIQAKLDRDIEDYELDVCSAGLTEPFKILRQYEKNIGNDVEVLTLDGKKLKGILKNAEQEFFTVTIEKAIKPEGAKRKIIVNEDVVLKYNEIKYTKYDLKLS
jgi:Uncharacterized protein conserved in bacteria